MIDDDSKPDSDERDDDAILTEARERYTQIAEDDRENRDNQRSDFEFVYVQGKQWTDEVRARRTGWDEPCLEFDQLKQFVNQVVNDERQNKPAILVHPAGGGASKEVAEIEQGLIRAIEYDSNAEAAYDNGFQSAVVGGRGWWRVCTEYEKPQQGKPSFNQKIVIKPILDALTVYASLDYEQPDASDRPYLFVIEKVKKTDFEKRWPKAEAVSFDTMEGNWKEGKDIIFVADYYRRVCTYRTLVAMSDGAVGYKDEMPPPPPGVFEVKSREVESWSVEWFKLAGGQQILEEYDCPGEIIPVIQTTGDDILIEGKRMYQGLICKARDAQAMYNFGMTQQAIHLALTPKAPWVAPQEAIEDYQNIWKNANTQNYSVLPYKHKDRDGQPIERPTRTAPSMPDAGWINWCGTMTQVMRSTIGMYENSLGMKGTEISGKAILAREKQGDVGTFHYVDNQHRAIALTGRVIQSWIPVYYDTEQIVHIIGKDGVRKMVTINQTTMQPTGDATNPLRAIKVNDLTSGDYAVAIEAGPGYATKREETAEKLMSLVNSFPQMMQVAGDVVIKSLDISDADIIADRFKFALPAPIQQALAAQEQGAKPPDPVMAGKLMQAEQKAQLAAQAIEKLTQENQQLKTGAQVDMAKVAATKDARMEELKLDDAVATEKARLERERFEFEKRLAIDRANLEIDLNERKAKSAHSLAADKHVAELGRMAAEQKTKAEASAEPAIQQMTQTLSEMLANIGAVLQEQVQILQRTESTQQQIYQHQISTKRVGISGVKLGADGIIQSADVSATIQ